MSILKRDLVDRLDEWVGGGYPVDGAEWHEIQELLAEASDEIRRLRVEVAFLEEQ